MVNNTSVNTGVHNLFKLVILFSLEKYPKVKLLDHMGGWVGVCVCVRGRAHVCAHAQSCPTLCDQPGWSLLGFPVNGILLARILEWVAISYSRGSS